MFQITLLILSFFILAAWFIRLKHTLDFLKGDHVIDLFSRESLTFPVPKISVIIPARNEEGNISLCLDSLLEQDYPDYEIIVVDDRSSDSTLKVVRSKTNEKIKVLEIKELPEGWTGKNHALHQGVQQSEGEWFLFTDADTIHQKDSLSMAMGHAIRRKAEMLSLTPGLENKTFWEKVMQPLAGGALMLRFPLRAVNDPTKKIAFGNGQYILIRKKTYDAVGGHAALKNIMLEDVALSKRVKGADHALHVGYGADLFKTRMYSSFSSIFHGWSRIYYSAFGDSLPFLLALMGLVWLVSLGPYFLGLYSIWLVLTEFSFFSIILFGMVVFQFLVMLPTLLNTYRLSHSDPAYIFYYGPACLVLFGILTHAFFKILFKQKVNWRGDQYMENRTG